MKLYIANTSHQTHQFTFRVPESGRMRHMVIGSGQQECVFDGSPEAVEAIVRQHEVYGLYNAAEARRRGKSYHGLCYSTETPVKADTMVSIDKGNHATLTERGEAIRRQAGMHAALDMRNVVQEGRQRGLSVDLGDTAMDFRDDNESGPPQQFNETIQYKDQPGETSGKRGRSR